LWVERALVGDNEKDGGEENLSPALSTSPPAPLLEARGAREGDCKTAKVGKLRSVKKKEKCDNS